MLRALLPLVLALPLVASREELHGTVVAVSGYRVEIELEGELVPNLEDRVEIGFEVPGAGLVPIDGTWIVSDFKGERVLAEPSGSVSGRPTPGMVATIHSESPRGKDEQMMRPEQDPYYWELPVETEGTVECETIHAITTHPGFGHAMLFGVNGFMCGLTWPHVYLEPFELPVEGDVLAAVMDADDNLFLGGSARVVRRFARGKGGVQASYPAEGALRRPVRVLTLSPDGALLAVATDGGRLFVYEVESGLEVLRHEVGGPRIHAMALSSDGEWLAYADESGAIDVLDPRDEDESWGLHLHGGPVRGIAFDADGTELWTAGEDGRIVAVDIQTQRPVRHAEPLDGPIVKFAAAPEAFDRPLLAVAGRDGRVAFVHGATFEVLGELPHPRPDVTAIALNKMGMFLTVAYRGGAVRTVFAYKLLRGDTFPQDWEEAEAVAELAAYRDLGARLGLVLRPAKLDGEPGLQVEGWLLGFPRPPEGELPPGALITHVQREDGFQPVADALELPAEWDHVTVRLRSRAGGGSELRLPVVSADDARRLGETVCALLAGEELFELGFEVLDSGYVHRVVSGSAAEQAHIRPGDTIVSANGAPWRTVGRDWTRPRKASAAVTLVIDRFGRQRTVEVTPLAVPPIVKHALLTGYYGVSGDMKRMGHHAETALEISEEEPRMYEIAVAVMAVHEPEGALEGLRHGIDGTGETAPLLESLGRVMRMQGEVEEAYERLADPVTAYRDHKLQLVFGSLACNLGHYREAVAVLEEICERGDEEAFLPYARSLLALGEEREAARYYRLHYYGSDAGVRILRADGSPATPRHGLADDDPEFQRFVELARKLVIE